MAARKYKVKITVYKKFDCPELDDRGLHRAYSVMSQAVSIIELPG